MSRGSHVPPGRTRRSSTGQRVAGGLVLQGSGVRGHAMYKSSLCSTARDCSSGKRHAGMLARVVWAGGDGKGGICPTSPAPYCILRGASGGNITPLPDLDDVIARAVQWYLRFRLSYADLAELLA